MSKHPCVPGCFGDPLLLHQSIGCSWESFGNETSSAGMAWHRWHFRNRLCWKRLAVTLLRNTAKPALCQIRLPLFPSASHFHSPLPSSLSFSLSPHPFLACSLFFSLSLVLRSRCNVILLCFQHVVFKMKRDKNCFCGENTYISIYQTVTTSENICGWSLQPSGLSEARGHPAFQQIFVMCFWGSPGLSPGSAKDLGFCSTFKNPKPPTANRYFIYLKRQRDTSDWKSDAIDQDPYHVKQTVSVENSRAGCIFCFICVCVCVFSFYLITMSKEKTITFQLMYIPCRERELTSDFDHVLSGGK